MAKLTIDAGGSGPMIARHIYGQFAEHLGRCVYEGLWVGKDSPIVNTRGFRNDVIEALRKLRVPNLRWPGGCFADTYHWMDGVGPKRKRPSMVNVHWGGTTENNHVGTHEFFDLCEMLGTQPYIAGNVGSGTVKEMAEWLEYITMPGESPMATLRRENGREGPWPLTFWGVGNENWGCGGNMRPQYYADLFRQYASYCRQFTPGQTLYKVACGLTDDWNEIVMRDCHKAMSGLSIHYYTVLGDWQTSKGSATDFGTDDWKLTMHKAAGIEAFIKGTAALMDRYDPAKRVGIVMDEWGTWFDVEPGTNPGFLYQQNTIRDALVAGLTLNIFNNHADRVQVANIAQVVNVLQAMILTEGPKMLLTPTYHVFEMYKVHQDATLLPTTVDSEVYLPAAPVKGAPGAGGYTNLDATQQLSVSASRDANGVIHVSLCNLHHDLAAEVQIDLRGVDATTVKGRLLTAPAQNSMNTFDKPDAVEPVDYDAFKVSKTGIAGSLPARSVAVLEIK